MQFPLPPRTLLQNRYSIVRQIGQGAMGAVYEAKDERLGHRVALKQRIVSGPEVEQAFKREARTLATLRYWALPAVSDYFIEANHQFLVMQYIPGDDLHTLLQRQGRPFPVTEVLEWADQLLGALEFLHSQSPPIIHRDIKPENIKLSPRGEVILLDFGISKGGGTNNTHSPMSGASIAAFTPNYASLEQIESQGTNERSDLYSLGVTLHHLLTGVLPPTAVTRASAQIYAKPDPLRPANELNPQVPASLATLLTQATALKDTQRPHSASAMRAMLKAAAPAARKEVPFYEPETPVWPNTPPSPAEPPTPAPPTEKWSPAARKEVPLYEPETPVFPKWPNTPPPPAEPPTPTPAPPTEKSIAPVVFKATKEINPTNKSVIKSFFVFYFIFGFITTLIIDPDDYFSMLTCELHKNECNPIVIAIYLLFIVGFCIIWFYHKIAEPRRSEVAYCIDSKKLAVTRRAISLYDATTLDEETFLRNGYFSLVPVQSMALSPDGVTVAEASGKTIKLWDVVSGVVQSTLKGSFATVKSLAFSPDGARVASALDDGTIRLWNIDSGTVRSTLAGHSAAVNSVAFSPDGATLASASDDKTIKLWDVATESLRSTLKEHSGPINRVAFSPDGTWLASASDDKSIKLWHMPSATLRATLRGHALRVNRVTFSPNGDLLASASDDKTARLWDVASGTLRAYLLDHTKEVTSVAFSPDGQTLASTSKDGSVRLWDLCPLE